MFSDVACHLRRELASDNRKSELDKARKLLEGLPQGSRAPLVDLEDRLILGIFDSRAQARAKAILRQVFVAIHQEGRPGLWRWALGLPQRIPEIASWPETASLRALAHLKLFGYPPPALDFTDRDLLRGGRDYVKIGVRHSGGILDVRDLPRVGDILIDVPDGPMRVIDLNYLSNASSTTARAQWPSGLSGGHRAAELPLTILAADGSEFHLTTRRIDVGNFISDVGKYLATIHDSDGREVGVGWMAQTGLILTSTAALRKAKPLNGRVDVRFPFLRGSASKGTISAQSLSKIEADTPAVVRLSPPPEATAAKIGYSENGLLPVVPSVLRDGARPEERWWRFRRDSALARAKLDSASLMTDEIRAGCAGAPVVDAETRQVLGMCILEGREAFCITWQELVRLVPELRQRAGKPLIFISYAQADELEKPRGEDIQWLTFVMKFLRPAVKSGEFAIWVDRQMPGGTKWDEEIERNLRACDIFVLLVSANSMASDYIIDKAIEIARERQAAGDDLHVYPLLLQPTPKAGLDRVRDFNLRPRDAKPFSGYSLHDRNQHMSDAADEIAAITAAIAERKSATAPSAPAPPKPIFVHISGLPETGYERLVGRDAELAQLDEAWSEDRTNVLSLVAEGGAGKSALVNEWLAQIQADGYRGADCVLGWSFYSQGSKERTTSADEFLNWVLAKFGVTVTPNSASGKGEAVAEALMGRRALLVLDGVEPLQHGPGGQAGQLKDQGLRALLRRFAATAPSAKHSLIVLTSRVAVADIERFRTDAAAVVDVERLSDEAGAELLRDNGVWGVDRELRAASHDFGGHALALTLLASLLKDTQNGDARRRDHIRGLLADADNPRHDHARRVMESYEREWLAGQPILLAVLYLVGLFDRPASGDSLRGLRAKPAIRGLTEAIVGLAEEEWRRAVARLRVVKLLAPVDASDPDALDAHPLVREWFGERLRRMNEASWKAAHSRLYDHLRRTTHEGETPTLADLAPLYHAIAHGCRAGRYQEALDAVYINRICRRQRNDEIEFYSIRKLGAVGSDLAAIAWFFDRPFETPATGLPPRDRAFVLGQASYGLRAQGRLHEALPAMRASLHLREVAQDWTYTAISAAELSETELLVGDIAAAVAVAEEAVALADRAGDAFQMLRNRTTSADVLHAAGGREKAEGLFAEAERRQQELQPELPLLYSLQGYRYCDLLLSQGRAAVVRDRAAQSLQIARQNNWVLDIALDTLTLGRAHLALALETLARGLSADNAQADARVAAARLDEAIEGLRASGQNDHIPRGLLARAAFHRAVSDWYGAARDLDEAQEIAEPGPMRLYLCDCALERARVALARREAVAPLNGFVEPSPPPPALPDAAVAAELRHDARKELVAARKLIAECGYHRRDEELAELDAVVTGRRRFADLPARV